MFAARSYLAKNIQNLKPVAPKIEENQPPPEPKTISELAAEFNAKLKEKDVQLRSIEGKKLRKQYSKKFEDMLHKLYPSKNFYQ